MYCNSWTFKWIIQTRVPPEIYEKTQKQKIKNKNQIKKLLNLFVGFVIVGNFLGMRLCFFFSEWVRNCEWMARNCEHSAESLALSCIFPESSSCMCYVSNDLLTLYYYNNKFGVKYYHDRHVHSARLIWFSCKANSKSADELKPINLLLIF